MRKSSSPFIHTEHITSDHVNKHVHPYFLGRLSYNYLATFFLPMVLLKGYPPTTWLDALQEDLWHGYLLLMTPSLFENT